MHDDRASIRRHHARASPKKSVAGRARGDPNPPHASVAGLIFCGARVAKVEVYENSQINNYFQVYISNFHPFIVFISGITNGKRTSTHLVDIV
jgi:hypothetical protein